MVFPTVIQSFTRLLVYCLLCASIGSVSVNKRVIEQLLGAEDLAGVGGELTVLMEFWGYVCWGVGGFGTGRCLE